LPLYPDMSEDDVRYVCKSIQDILAVNQKHSRRSQPSLR
jgi:hypothetical protein